MVEIKFQFIPALDSALSYRLIARVYAKPSLPDVLANNFVLF